MKLFKQPDPKSNNGKLKKKPNIIFKKMKKMSKNKIKMIKKDKYLMCKQYPHHVDIDFFSITC